MAARLSGHELSDLCLGKPPLRSLSVGDTVGDALSALKRLDDTFLTVWTCHHSFLSKHTKCTCTSAPCTCTCTCIAKICMVDIICFLSKPHNLSAPAAALHSPLSALLPDCSPLVRHLPPSASLVEAIDVMYEGVQNLVIPIATEKGNKKNKGTVHNKNTTYCWLSQEDVIRYLLNSIAVFSPMPANPINTLGVIDTHNLFALGYHDPASSALDLLPLSLIYQSSVAILDPNGKFVAEISPFRLNSCDDALVPALAVLSAGDFTSYIDCAGPPEDLLLLVKDRLRHHHHFSSSSSSSSSSGKHSKHAGYPGRAARRSEAIVCYRWSSLVAVMIQALAHRVSYVWVVEEDGTLTGIVTFQAMLKVFRDHLKSIS